MKFSEVTGQKELKNRFIRMIRENRLPHALMLAGPPGYGGLPLAVALAQYISCNNRGEEDSCGTCPSCLKYKKLIHPDLHFVFPVNKGKKLDVKEPVSDDAIPLWRELFLEEPYFTLNRWYEQLGFENQQGIITTAESGKILRKLSLKTYESEYKVMIIWYPEKMNQQAANKILKILEEPPEGTVFILVAENPESMLTTVTSRTQIFVLPPVDHESLKNTIAARYALPGKELEEVIRLARGDMYRAMETVRLKEENQERLRQFISLMRLSFKCNEKMPELLSWVDEISALGREKQKEFLVYGLRMIRENLFLGMMADKKQELVFMNKEEENFSHKFSAFIHAGNIEAITREFNEAIRHIEANAYARIVFLDLSLKLSELIYREN
ncbi:MAG TPA: DNA polymerase III subunit delta [Bacteroidetes bacterium]|nr:DNA polymerase III subunit delta [Bacteroidota bacterium]